MADDVNNTTLEQKAIEQNAAGMTEGQKELANGEQVGDRLGDEPVAGVEQTRNGIGELVAEAKTLVAKPHWEAPTQTPDGADAMQDIKVMHASRLHEIFEEIKQFLEKLV